MKQIFTLFLALLTLIGCSDFLDKAAENSYQEQSVDYTQTERMFEPVSGVYAKMRSSSFWAGYALLALRGDDCLKGGADGTLEEFNSCKNFEYSTIANFEFLNLYWQKLYEIVIVANSALESLELYKAHITEPDDLTLYSEYSSQVRTLRAMAYFRIAQLWEEAPILYTNQTSVTKCSTEDKYSYIIEELSEASSSLLAIHPNQHTKPGCVTKYTALALWAKVELYRKNWSEVERLTEIVINSQLFALYPSFYDLFKLEGKLCCESIFELQFLAESDENSVEIESEEWFTSQGPMSTPPPIYGWGYLVPSNEIINFMTARGESIRSQTTFLQTGETTPSGDYIFPALDGQPTVYNGKAYTPSSSSNSYYTEYGSGNNIRVIRYADILLMNSEAKIMQGLNGDATLNLVRERASISSISSATIDDVIDERRAEFALEWGERYFDMLRHNLATTQLPNFSNDKQFYPTPTEQLAINPSLY